MCRAAREDAGCGVCDTAAGCHQRGFPGPRGGRNSPQNVSSRPRARRCTPRNLKQVLLSLQASCHACCRCSARLQLALLQGLPPAQEITQAWLLAVSSEHVSSAVLNVDRLSLVPNCRGLDGATYAAARRAAEAEPLNAAVQNAAGLAAEARGDHAAAHAAYSSAAALLQSGSRGVPLCSGKHVSAEIDPTVGRATNSCISQALLARGALHSRIF